MFIRADVDASITSTQNSPQWKSFDGLTKHFQDASERFVRVTFCARVYSEQVELAEIMNKSLPGAIKRISPFDTDTGKLSVCLPVYLSALWYH